VAKATARRKRDITSSYFLVIYVAVSGPVAGLGATATLLGLLAGVLLERIRRQYS